MVGRLRHLHIQWTRQNRVPAGTNITLSIHFGQTNRVYIAESITLSRFHVISSQNPSSSKIYNTISWQLISHLVKKSLANLTKNILIGKRIECRFTDQIHTSKRETTPQYKTTSGSYRWCLSPGIHRSHTCRSAAAGWGETSRRRWPPSVEPEWCPRPPLSVLMACQTHKHTHAKCLDRHMWPTRQSWSCRDACDRDLHVGMETG